MNNVEIKIREKKKKNNENDKIKEEKENREDKRDENYKKGKEPFESKEKQSDSIAYNSNLTFPKRPVEQIIVNESKDIYQLINQLSNTGFNAKRLAQACRIYEKMIKSKNCIKFMALAGAMVPVGMQRVIYDFIEEGFVDVLVTTGANLTHDLVEALGEHHLQGLAVVDYEMDKQLYQARMNRIYDVFMPNDIYETMEDWLKTIEISPTTSVKELLWEIGDQLPENSKSILKICAKKRIPIYCPAFTDSGLGMQLSFIYPKLNLNFIEDLRDMINLAWDSNEPGICIVGGGVPKNFIFQAMQFSPNSARYVIQITTDVQVSAGGLSSASLNEAISWGKINAEGETTQVHLDATVVLPLLLSYLKTSKQNKK